MPHGVNSYSSNKSKVTNIRNFLCQQLNWQGMRNVNVLLVFPVRRMETQFPFRSRYHQCYRVHWKLLWSIYFNVYKYIQHCLVHGKSGFLRSVQWAFIRKNHFVALFMGKFSFPWSIQCVLRRKKSFCSLVYGKVAFFFHTVFNAHYFVKKWFSLSKVSSVLKKISSFQNYLPRYIWQLLFCSNILFPASLTYF
jgi:hypothetical protein